MIRTRAIFLGWFIVALAFPQRAWAVTTTEGSDASGMAGTPMLDKTTKRVKCEQSTRGPTVTLPGSSATAWNACASVTTTYSDYCGNVAYGSPCFDGNVMLNARGIKLNGATSGTVTHDVAATTASYTLRDPSTAPGAGQAIVYPSGGGQGTWATPLAGNGELCPR